MLNSQQICQAVQKVVLRESRILQLNSRAPYIHCSSHDLNLALCHATKQQTVLIMMENLVAIGRFFNYSPKRWELFSTSINDSEQKACLLVHMLKFIYFFFSQRALEEVIKEFNKGKPKSQLITKTKVKAICQTRWVEKHEIFKFSRLHCCHN